MGSPEMGYIHHLDKELHPESDKGKEAERVVIEFFQKAFPGKVEVRPADEEEDSGKGGQIVDAVAYLDGKAAMGLQITTATDKEARLKKMEEMRQSPFIRLPKEMQPKDPNIPRVLVFLEQKEVKSYQDDPQHDLKQHRRLSQQILESSINSLKFDLLMTKNPREIHRINTLLSLLEQEKKKFIQ